MELNEIDTLANKLLESPIPIADMSDIQELDSISS